MVISIISWLEETIKQQAMQLCNWWQKSNLNYKFEACGALSMEKIQHMGDSYNWNLRLKLLEKLKGKILIKH